MIGKFKIPNHKKPGPKNNTNNFNKVENQITVRRRSEVNTKNITVNTESTKFKSGTFEINYMGLRKIEAPEPICSSGRKRAYSWGKESTDNAKRSKPTPQTPRVTAQEALDWCNASVSVKGFKELLEKLDDDFFTGKLANSTHFKQFCNLVSMLHPHIEALKKCTQTEAYLNCLREHYLDFEAALDFSVHYEEIDIDLLAQMKVLWDVFYKKTNSNENLTSEDSTHRIQESEIERKNRVGRLQEKLFGQQAQEVESLETPLNQSCENTCPPPLFSEEDWNLILNFDEDGVITV